MAGAGSEVHSLTPQAACLCVDENVTRQLPAPVLTPSPFTMKDSYLSLAFRQSSRKVTDALSGTQAHMHTNFLSEVMP